MDRFMHLLAPKGWIGFAIRLVLLVALVAVANILFSRFFDSVDNHELHHPSFYIKHATVVGGPFIAFFLAVSVFQVRLQQRLSKLSRKDGLTGLNNRRTFFDLVERVRADEAKGVLLILDADHFKQINDTYGHLAGDCCLKSIAHTLNRNLRKNDVLSRIGGEEFALYLTGASVETARVIGERFAKPICFNAQTTKNLSVTLSIGAAQSQPGVSTDELCARADAALYRAKANGRAQYQEWEAGNETVRMTGTA